MLDEKAVKDCRKEVLDFALGMEAKLRKNEYKGGWKITPTKFLAKKLLEEVAELLHSTELQGLTDAQLVEMFKVELSQLPKDYHSLTNTSSESFDVGNISMMFSDPERLQWERSGH